VPLRHRSLRLGVLEVVVLVAFLVGAALVVRGFRDADAVIAREEAALRWVRHLGAREAAFRDAHRLDRNGDGQAEFGGLDDLRAAGLLDRATVTDEEGPFLPLEGYRIEVLLPAETDAAGRRTLTGRPERADARLAAQQFAVVARPRRGGPRALRSFYLDAQGWLYAAEGVYDPDRDPCAPPPRLELREERDAGGTEDGPVWRRLEPPRHGTD
jgi:hypothetical protein